MLRVEYALTTDRTMKALAGLPRAAFRALIPAFDGAGGLYGVHRSRAHRWTQDRLPVLEKTLGQKRVLPERQIHPVEALFHLFPTAQTLFIDGSERPTQRPQDATEQKNYDSGKAEKTTRPKTQRSGSRV